MRGPKVLLFFVWLLSVECHGLVVLTSQSYTGKGSLSEFLKGEYQRAHPGESVEFREARELSGLLGSLRSRRARDVDVVLGLGAMDHVTAIGESRILPGRVFERSPFAILLNTKMLQGKPLPRDWNDLAGSWKNSLLLPDPRFSSAGEGWVRAIFEHKLLSPAEAKSIVKTIYPSWSAAYEAFSKEKAPLVWSYQTSEAYHRCHGQTHVRALPLGKGYPEQEQFVAATPGGNQKAAAQFIALLLSSEVQSQLPMKNWMLPAQPGSRLPDCFQEVTPLNVLPAMNVEAKSFRAWLDEWSLN